MTGLTAAHALIAALLGLLAGSFLNVVIFRGPRLWRLVDGEPRGDLAAPGSYCPACKTRLSPLSLIPLVSFVVQKGRCASCGARISWRYPVVEALGATVGILSVATFGATPAAVLAALFGFALVALAFIDLETGYLPDAITYPLIALGLIANGFGVFTPFADALIGALAGYLAFWGIGALYQKLRGHEGLGQGDKKLLAAIGAFGGWVILPAVVFFAAAATLAFALAPAILRQRDFAEPIPFGPGLCAAGFAALLGAAPLRALLSGL